MPSTRLMPCRAGLLTAVLLLGAGVGADAQQTTPAAPQEPALAPESGAIITPSTPAPVPTRWTARQLDSAFMAADGDRDGVLSRAEAQAYTRVRLNFEELDANKDGSLSRAEFEKGIR